VTDIDAIKLARSHYNAAILQRDVAKICTFFQTDYQVQTARGIFSKGVEEQKLRWTKTFNTDPSALYRRHSLKLSLGELQNSAQEQGRWVGRYSENQQLVLVAGSYVAQWQKSLSGVWLIQAEAFTQIKCKHYTLEVIPL
jgi:ketosteroid isomerase-like protein